ncbi:MAG: VWA domain-containing protein, partial [Oscillibacter sp.]|nr:VWA domain-containing protein [Oscillibacter sp.]
MTTPRLCKRILLLFCVLLCLPNLCAGAAESTRAGRKMILVLDASLSLSGYTDRGTGQRVAGTDPDGYRFDAIEEFLDYLRRDTATGSRERYEVGYVIFSNDIDASRDPEPLEASDLSRSALETATRQAKGQYTNTGAALWEAVRLAGRGNPDARAAILLVSDGLTDLGRDTAAQERSETLKADAIRTAKERNIPILTLCLNMNGAADLSEMREIASDARYFRELNSNRYLSEELFALLTESIGTDTVYIPQPDDTPLVFRDGALEVPFVIPGFGLDSVQIMLVGRTFAELDDVRLMGPDGLTLTRAELLSDGDALLNVPVDRPGNWTLRLEGRQGATVRLRLLYNADLQVNVSVSEGNPCEIRATLEAAGVVADSPEQYQGFQAELLVVSDAAATTEPYRETMKAAPDGNGFVTEFEPPDMGTYRFAVRVSAPGELTVAENAENVRSFPIEPCQFVSDWTERTFTAPPPVDNPPQILQDPVKVKLYLGDTLSVDLRQYVEDESPETLSYSLLRAPDGASAALSDGVLSAENYTVPTGSFIVSVADAAGQSAELYVEVSAVERPNPLIPFLIVLFVLAALFIAATFARLNAPYHGTIEI